MICDRATLSEAISLAASVAKEDPSRPVYGNLFIQEDGDNVHISATDGATFIRATVAGVRDTSGFSALISAKSISQAISASDGASAKIDMSEFSASVDCGDVQFSIPIVAGHVLPKGDYSMATGGQFVPSSDMVDGIDLAMMCVDRSKGSMVLSGVCISRDGDNLCLAGTCGKRLAEYRIPCDADLSMILPLPSCVALRRLCAMSDGDVAIAGGGGKCVAMASNGAVSVAIQARTLDGAYPGYRLYTRNPAGNVLTARTSDLAAGLRRASVMSSGPTRIMAVDLRSDHAVIRTHGAERKAHTEVACAWDGPDTTIGINEVLFSPMLKKTDADDIRIYIGAGKPILWSTETATMMCMPVVLLESA